MIRSFRAFDQRKPRPQTRPQIDINWPRDELLEIARLLDHLAPPDHHNPERYFEQKRIGASAAPLSASHCVNKEEVR